MTLLQSIALKHLAKRMKRFTLLKAMHSRKQQRLLIVLNHMTHDQSLLTGLDYWTSGLLDWTILDWTTLDWTTGLDTTGLTQTVMNLGREQALCAYLAPNFTKFASLAC